MVLASAEKTALWKNGVSDAQNMLGFVDGHVNYTKIFWNPQFQMLTAACYDPPSNYDCKWSAD